MTARAVMVSGASTSMKASGVAREGHRSAPISTGVGSTTDDPVAPGESRRPRRVNPSTDAA